MSYERLELLGDAVLQLVATAELYRRHPHASEGDLAWMRQGVVGREACAAAGRSAGLPDAMIAAAPERDRASAVAMAAQPSVQAALVEALIGAAWLDLGPGLTEPAVRSAFAPALDRAAIGERDPKTSLQEEAARRRLDVRYEVVAAEGPPHARVFESRAVVGGEPLGSGRGPSKQASEREAATIAIARLVEREETPC